MNNGWFNLPDRLALSWLLRILLNIKRALKIHLLDLMLLTCGRDVTKLVTPLRDVTLPLHHGYRDVASHLPLLLPLVPVIVTIIFTVTITVMSRHGNVDFTINLSRHASVTSA
jgi:hypothetical protein